MLTSTTNGVSWAHIVIFISFFPYAVDNFGPSRPPAPTPVVPTGRAQPIAVPAIHLEELKEITKNFSSDALIGEGSYARVYFGVLKDGTKSAVKKLDSSKQPDQEFLVQVVPPLLLSYNVSSSRCSSSHSHFLCRFQLSQDWSMRMLSNSSVTAPKGAPAFLLMSMQQGDHCMISSMVGSKSSISFHKLSVFIIFIACENIYLVP